MMEGTVPWWRRALSFTLNGIRSRWRRFARNAKSEASKKTSAESRHPTIELEHPEEDTKLKHPSLNSEEVMAETGEAADKAGTTDAQPAAHAVEAEVAAIQSGADEQAADVVSGETAGPVEIEVEAASGVETVTEGVDLAEAPAESNLAQEEPQPEPLPAQPDLAEPVEAEPAAADPPPMPENLVQETAASEMTPALPFAAKPAVQTSAEKVAAALKARGQDAEQSPFSVIVSQVYDGPLDLLLDLIRKQDIDIYDIPIAKITAQFLAYVDQLKASDMDVAGEFIYTAALLIHIKSKMLLPRAPAGPEEAVEDPRRELVERLLEHERFKNAAQMLLEKQMLEAATWSNPGAREFHEEEGANAEGAPEIAADTVDLVRVFREILERARNRPVINVEEDSVTVGQMIQFLARRLTMEEKPVALRRLLSHTRSERALIAMFLALLEMVRLQAILLRQDRQFSEIFIKKNTGFEVAMNQGLANARDDWR